MKRRHLHVHFARPALLLVVQEALVVRFAESESFHLNKDQARVQAAARESLTRETLPQLVQIVVQDHFLLQLL